VWNDKGAALEFTLAPAYYQTLWFRLLCVGIAVTLTLMLLRLRLQSAHRDMRMRYEERVEERACIAQGLHHHLIQEMVGIGIQLEVQRRRPLKAQAQEGRLSKPWLFRARRSPVDG
jgi:signal transduction histidine kinase